MTTTTGYFNKGGERRPRRAGFTLVEILVSMGLASMILVSVLSSFIFFGKSSSSVGTYSDMSRESRRTLELLAQDIRMAEDVIVAQPYRLILQEPASIGGNRVWYEFDIDELNFTRTEMNGLTVVQQKTLLNNVELFNFAYYNIRGDLTTKLIEAKSVRIDAEMARYVTGLRNTDYIISARFMMRNREVSQ